MLAKDVRAHYHPTGFDHPAAIALHEFGHIVDIETIGEVSRPEISAIVQRWAAEAGVTPDQLIKFEVSRYAAYDERELAAEAFSDVLLNGLSASRLSSEIYRTLRTAYEDGGREFVPTSRVVAQATADLNRMTVPQLRALIRERGIRGLSKAPKARLLEALRAAAPEVPPAPAVTAKEAKNLVKFADNVEIVRLTRADVERVDLSRPRSELGTEARRIADTIRGDEVSRTPLGGGSVGDVALVRYGDGTTLVRKELGSRAADVRTVRDQMDAEELAPLVLRAVGADAPEVLRVGDRVLYMSHVEGELGADIVPWGASVPADVVDSPQGVRLGLGDLLMENGDRNAANWFRRGTGELVGIDHGFAFQGEPTTSPFADRFLAGGSGGLTRAEAAAILDRLTMLRPEFTRLRRLGWWRGMMGRMREVVDSASRANG
jgi:hypothetical protein